MRGNQLYLDFGFEISDFGYEREVGYRAVIG